MTNVAKVDFYPTLKVTTSGGLQVIWKNGFSANSIFCNVITGLTQPYFQSKTSKNEVWNSESESKAYLQFEQSLLTAGKVSDALAVQ
jgi:outer membrane protein TolC